jgi:hypothetical protein
VDSTPPEESTSAAGALPLSTNDLEAFQTPRTVIPGPLVIGEGDSDTSVSSIDSPLPANRAGPVVIPKFNYLSRSIRAEPGSPYRSLPQPISDDFALTMHEEDHKTRLSVVDSPPSSSRNPDPALSMTPGQIKSDDTNRLGSSLQSSSTLVTGSVTRRPLFSTSPQKMDKKTVKRTLLIRSQLDAAVANSKNAPGTVKSGLMGPPQRTVSSSSISSGISGARPPSRAAFKPTVPIEPRRHLLSSAASKKAQTTLATSASTTLPQPKPASRPVVALPRPALVPRTLPQASVRPVPASVDVKLNRPMHVLAKPASMSNLRASVSTKAKSPDRSSNPLKRPLPVSQPIARPAISLGAPPRLNLGPPSRLVSTIQEPSERPVFHIGASVGDARQVFPSPALRRMGPPVRNALQGGASRGTPGSVRTFKVGPWVMRKR